MAKTTKQRKPEFRETLAPSLPFTALSREESNPVRVPSSLIVAVTAIIIGVAIGLVIRHSQGSSEVVVSGGAIATVSDVDFSRIAEAAILVTPASPMLQPGTTGADSLQGNAPDLQSGQPTSFYLSVLSQYTQQGSVGVPAAIR